MKFFRGSCGDAFKMRDKTVSGWNVSWSMNPSTMNLSGKSCPKSKEFDKEFLSMFLRVVGMARLIVDR